MTPLAQFDPANWGINPYTTTPIAPQSAAEPFVWGAGGEQITPDELARRQQVASALLKSNYSPVANVWQGLGRVADNVMGAIDQRQIDKDRAASTVSRNADIAVLLGQGNADLAPGLTSSDPVVAALAGDIYKARQPKQIAPSEFQRAIMDAGVDPASAQGRALALQRAQTLAEGQPIVVPDGMGGAQIIPRSSIGVAPQPQTLGNNLPQGWTIDQGDGASNGPAGFPR